MFQVITLAESASFPTNEWGVSTSVLLCLLVLSWLITLSLTVSVSRLRRAEARARKFWDDHERKAVYTIWELQEQIEQDRQASLATSEFLNTLSHRFRTPLTDILGYGGLMSDFLRSPSDMMNAIHVIQRNARMLKSLVNELSDLSALGAGRMVPDISRCAVYELVEDIVASMRHRAKENKLQLDLDLAATVPESIYSDPKWLRQTLAIILTHAIKVTPHGKIALRVYPRPSSCTEQSHLAFEVIYTGQTMSLEETKTLFQPFAKSTKASSVPQESGMNLAIARRLAQALGGDISVEHLCGGKMRMLVTVTAGACSDFHSMENNPTTVNAEVAPITDGGKRGRVLVVEDGPDNQLLIEHYLHAVGLDTIIASDGVSACKHALEAADKGKPYDIILMDMQMPEMDGWTATRLLRSAGYTGPIIALTAHALERDREACMAVGCSEFVLKPINPEILLESIQRYMDLSLENQESNTHANPHNIAIKTGRGFINSLNKSGEQLSRSNLDSLVTSIEQANANHDDARILFLVHQIKGLASGEDFDGVRRYSASVEDAMITEAAESTIRAAVLSLITECRSIADRKKCAMTE